MAHPTIKSRVDGSILFVSIDRLEKRKCTDSEMIDAVSAAVRRSRNQEPRV